MRNVDDLIWQNVTTRVFNPGYGLVGRDNPGWDYVFDNVTNPVVRNVFASARDSVR